MITGSVLDDKKILLVEDSNPSIDLISRVLQKTGGDLYVYDNLDNINDLLSRKYDIAIFDLYIHGGDTFQLIETLKQSSPDTKIIVQSSLTSSLLEQPSVSAHVDYVIEKPLTEEKIRKALTNSLFLPLKDKEVLIVEDARISVKILSRIVSKLGGAPYAFTDLTEEDKILNTHYDMAVLDLHLAKGVTTFHLINKLKEKNASILIFIVSAMPNALHSYPELMENIAYIFQKPISDEALEQSIIKATKQPFSDRRRSTRKSGIAQIWVALYHEEEKRADLFESPALLDISTHGFSFQSFLDYEEGNTIVFWLNDRNLYHEIIEVFGVIKWKKIAQTQKGNTFHYGVEYKDKGSPQLVNLQSIIAQISEESN